MVDVEKIVKECKVHMEKSMDHLKHELRVIRTGRASTGLVEYVKVDAYGSTTDLRNLAAISIGEPAVITIKPFDPATTNDIVKGIEKADLGLNPQSDGKVIRVPVPTLSGDRRKQLAAQAHKMGEQAKVAIRNSRRDANKHIDQVEKDKSESLSEDQAKAFKDDVQELTKKYEKQVDDLVSAKEKEITEV
ncbi:MAG: ribosome recycling factor [Planctomycetota bacterium]